jgi:hypothetical protein
MNKLNRSFRMKELFKIAGFSKQAHSSYMARKSETVDLEAFVLSLVSEMRENHPAMGLKKIYYNYQPDIIGRDSFIEQGVRLGLNLPRQRNYQRTTFSNKSSRIRNIASEIEINNVNQVWVSDITYFSIKSVFYYITFLMDVYSRFIVGYTASENLRAESSIKALEMALKARKNDDLSGLIHHSDRGTQYGSNLYLERLATNKIRPSMCDSVYENSHIERVNGIIKNEYLAHRQINNFKDLCKYLKQDVRNYNYFRPHWSIDAINPAEYEKQTLSTTIENRKSMRLFKEQKVENKYNQGEIFSNYN